MKFYHYLCSVNKTMNKQAKGIEPFLVIYNK